MELACADALSQTDANCWFAYRKGPALRFPHSMNLCAVPGSAPGIYNHFEFFLKLLAIESKPEKWEISECNYKQSSMKAFKIFGLSQRIGRPGQAAREEAPRQEPAAPSAPAAEQLDIGFFDAPLIFQEAAHPAGLPSHAACGSRQDGDKEDDEDKDDENFMFDEEEKFDYKDVCSSDEEQPQRAVRVPAGVDAEVDKGSESGQSVRSAAGGLKTVATDVDLLKRCLGEARLVCRCSLLFCLFCL